jgi:hypothetical protein
MRSAYTVGHSPAVAMLPRRLRRSRPEHRWARMLRAAGLLHDLGRAGVPWRSGQGRSAESRGARTRKTPSCATELLLAGPPA